MSRCCGPEVLFETCVDIKFVGDDDDDDEVQKDWITTEFLTKAVHYTRGCIILVALQTYSADAHFPIPERTKC